MLERASERERAGEKERERNNSSNVREPITTRENKKSPKP